MLFKWFLPILSVALLVFSFQPETAAEPSPTAGPSVVVPDETTALFNQASTFYEKRAEGDNADEAVALYKKVLEKDHDNYEALWHLGMAYCWLGCEGKGSERLTLFRQGKDYSERAVKSAPNAYDGYYWYGVCLGYACSEEKSLQSLSAIGRIIKALDTALTIKPKSGMAQHVLAMLYLNAPGWPLSCGDVHKSLNYAQQAVANAGDLVLTHLGLAKALIAVGKKSEAKSELENALQLPGPADWQPETAREKSKVRELLATLP
jgi:tetratricopeptide (TPR) repeat protein